MVGVVEARIDQPIGLAAAALAFAGDALEEAFALGGGLEDEGLSEEDGGLERTFGQCRVEAIAHHQRRGIELVIADMGLGVLGAAAVGQRVSPWDGARLSPKRVARLGRSGSTGGHSRARRDGSRGDS